jgi:TorA maturation chaperone TorD
MTTAQPIRFESPDQGEETARADLYGLLATLFYNAPAQSLLDAIATTETHASESLLQQSWASLSDFCKETTANSVLQEYEDLFIGVGKPEVILYGSYYLSGFMMEKPLAELRSELARLGLQRAESVTESEDHIASLCEVMRYLIASDDPVHANIATQKQFFSNHIQPWVLDMCAAVADHPDARFYSLVAQLARDFFEVEMQAFDMT